MRVRPHTSESQQLLAAWKVSFPAYLVAMSFHGVGALAGGSGPQGQPELHAFGGGGPGRDPQRTANFHTISPPAHYPQIQPPVDLQGHLAGIASRYDTQTMSQTRDSVSREVIQQRSGRVSTNVGGLLPDSRATIGSVSATAGGSGGGDRSSTIVGSNLKSNLEVVSPNYVSQPSLLKPTS